MITIGIDPGLTGAIGILSNGLYLAVEDMPCVTKGSGSVKREVDPAGLIMLLRRHAPADAAVSVGDSFGCARSAVAACRFELVYIGPAQWKKHFNLQRDKELSRALAVRMFPDAELHLKKHADRAEALLMARWLYEKRQGGNV